jgi:protein SCO1
MAGMAGRAGFAGLAGLAAGAGLALALAGCAVDSTAGTPGSAELGSSSPYRGVALTEPIDKPSTTGLVDQAGKPYDLRTATEGEVTLVFVGCTHCSADCPATLKTLARAVAELSPQEQALVQVVFITADPARDTPRRLATWLAAFDPGFVGLTGPVGRIDSIATAMRIAAFPPARTPSGTIMVMHGDQVVGFGADGESHLIWTNGTPAADIAHDLRLLVYDQT